MLHGNWIYRLVLVTADIFDIISESSCAKLNLKFIELLSCAENEFLSSLILNCKKRSSVMPHSKILLGFLLLVADRSNTKMTPFYFFYSTMLMSNTAYTRLI